MAVSDPYENKDIALIDILDTVLYKGVAIQGDLVISIAGIDLVYVDLKILIAAVETLAEAREREIASIKFDEEREALERATED
ncbi:MULTISPECIES: gas vesicle protein [Salimicrobium]|uniref:Gas vesicle protein GvpS n=2 Tax=Salimicrobium TaxID=351195 RepID=K2GCY9_9BACI|nr:MULTISPECIES: gas vesicle protein [Salimicrobium]AKG03853.1 gas vesicle protein GvpS [Salimicrobium jeotgali]EKE32878.1 gas vesicle protein GvpS [Salimicrobium jeotgali]MBM7695129.1 Na+-transporting methylmalonyl-CoA/oxaloacetate decarboxylase gamma subunit [Salimicrobium jeotgali]SDX96051.1 Gas vesicle protein [Salimicrobium album]